MVHFNATAFQWAVGLKVPHLLKTCQFVSQLFLALDPYHSAGSSSQFTWLLTASHEQLGNDCKLAFGEVELVPHVVAIARSSTATREDFGDQQVFPKRVDRILNLTLVVGDLRTAVAFLIAASGQSFQRQRVLIRSRKRLFHQNAEDTTLNLCQFFDLVFWFFVHCRFDREAALQLLWRIIVSPAWRETMEIDCQTVKAKLDAGEDFVFIDCREQNEYEIASIEGATLIPMGQIPERVSELESSKDREIIVHCHHGGRSMTVARWLKDNGFTKPLSMAGGIDLWAQDIDSSVPRY